MVRFVVLVVGVEPDTGREINLAEIESDRFDPEHLDAQVGVALDRARSSVKGGDLGSLRFWQPEVSAILSVGEEKIRPSLHLTIETLQRLVESGASFDFDPYV